MHFVCATEARDARSELVLVITLCANIPALGFQLRVLSCIDAVLSSKHISNVHAEVRIQQHSAYPVLT
jgi:hypothetical protein